jgi:membrane protein DedA with SNARE-associated domain
MSLLHISEKNHESADRWLVEHGRFSIFIATYIQFFYSVIALAAGTLKMKASSFFLSTSAGYSLKYVFLECVGFYDIYIFTSTFDYRQNSLHFAADFIFCLRCSLSRKNFGVACFWSEKWLRVIWNSWKRERRTPDA